jgi:ligand-binding sensor domain-containing protein
MKKYLFISLIVYGCLQMVLGQVYPVSRLSVKEGLPEYTVNKIAQDKLGYIWFGTGRGLARYDGSEVIKFDQSNGFVSGWVTDIEMDENGMIWISTDGSGIFIYNGTNFLNYNTSNGLPSDHIFDLLLADDLLYLATMDTGIVCIDKHRKIHCINKTDENIPIHVALRLLQRKNGNILVAGIDGMFEIIKKNDRRQVKALYTGGRVYSFFENKNQSILFSSGGGMYEMDAAGINIQPRFTEEIKDVIVKDILPDGRRLWLASNKGLYMITDRTVELIDKEKGLSSNTLKDIFKDRSGKIWLGTDNAGVNCMDATWIRHFYFSENEQPLITYALVEDSLHRMLFFTNQYGVAIYDGVHCTSYAPLGNLSSNILSSFRAADNSIWVTSVTGSISHLSKGKDVLNKLVIDQPGLYVVHIVPYNADTIVLSTSEGIYLMNAHTMEANKVEAFPTIYFRSCFVHHQTIWALGDGGEIYTYYKGTVKDYTSRINPEHYILTQGFVDEANNLLFFGTSYGLIAWDGLHKLLLNTNNGLHGDHINSITMDSAGYIWLGHNKGIEKLDIKNRKTRFLGYYQGFHPMETNTTVAYSDSKGILWFGTVESASGVDVSELEHDTVVPPVMIENILVNDKNYYHLNIGVDFAKELRLKYNENNLEFKFKSLNYFSSKEIMYQWKLEGFEENWKPATPQQQVNYTNLKPGTYQFLVKAVNTDGNASGITTLNIVIRKPFWQTLSFTIIEFSIVGLIVLLSFVFSKDPTKSRFANITTLLSIFIVFETALFYVSAYTDKYTHGIPVFQIVLNIILAMSLQPLEKMIKKFMLRFSRNSIRKRREQRIEKNKN